MSTNRFANQWLAFKGTTTGWDGSLVAGSDNDVPMPIAVATASGVTINAPAANITIAGVAPSVAAGKSISVPAANITLAGVAPSISVGASAAISAVNIAVAAVAPSVSAGKSVIVPAVDVAIAALAPTVSAGAGVGVTVDVPSVDIAVAAVAPTVSASAVQELIGRRRRSRRPIYELEGSKKKCRARRCGKSANISLPSTAFTIYWQSSKYCERLWN